MTEAQSRRRGRPAGQDRSAPVLVQVSAHLEPDLVALLDAEVREQGLRSRGEAIRIACADWVRRQEKRRQRPVGSGDVEASYSAQRSGRREGEKR